MKIKTAMTSFWLLMAAMLFGQTPSSQTAPPALAGVLEAPASALNKELPAWLVLGGEYRSRFEGYSGGSFKPATTDDYLLSRLKLNMTIKPVGWLKLFVEGMDARAFEKSPALPPYQNTWDIYQAYGEIGDVEKGLIDLKVGRQEMTFGEQRLIGNAPWLNTERVFDAARATVHYRGFRADLFASSVVNPVTGTWDHHLQGNNLHGIYGHIDRFGPKFVVEPYGLWRLQHGVKNEESIVSKLNEKVVGTRVAGSKLSGGFDYGLEFVREFGTLGIDNINAFAYHAAFGKSFSSPLSPRAFVEYNYATGDKNPKDGVRGTFDQLYPSGHDKLGFADQVGWRNVKDFRSGLEFKPQKKLTAALEYNDWFLASATDALYNAAGTALFRSVAGTAGTHVGDEFDVTGSWAFVRGFTAGAGIGHILPGRFLKTVTPGNPYTYPFMMLGWKF